MLTHYIQSCVVFINILGCKNEKWDKFSREKVVLSDIVWKRPYNIKMIYRNVY